MKYLSTLIVFLGICGSAAADEINDSLKSATSRGLAIVTRAANHWQKNKTCFSCHHQTLPMLAMIESQRVGIAVDKIALQSQADATHRYFQKRIDEMVAGEHVPGGAATVGYGLWAMTLDQRQPDITTSAMAAYLLKIQGVQRLDNAKQPAATQPHDGRWMASCRRAPLQSSEIGDTVLVLIGLEKYATVEQRPGLSIARASADKYLAQAKLKNQQDRLWRLWGLHRLDGDARTKEAVRAAILKYQRPDGGWSQNDNDSASDAYSTGQTLFMLCQTGTAPDDPVAIQARDYLIKTQLPDGSWLVESRLKYKAQPYFDNGDPHGEHQFISTAATCWATAALAQLLPKVPAPAPTPTQPH